MATLSPADRRLLDAAYEQAVKSLNEGGIPIGSALAAPDGTIIAAGHNMRVQSGDTTAHAEVVCIRAAGRRRDWHTLTLASTLSPCIMCSGTAILHRIPRVIIGEHKTFMGSEDLMRSHGTTLILADDHRCIEMMERFVRERPDLWNEDIGIPEDAS
ncbi:MAG: nucleoside deaminase [Phycisphaerales bacterium]|nr:nucleoside deaminase [Phycisphaerales bacterium]